MMFRVDSSCVVVECCAVWCDGYVGVMMVSLSVVYFVSVSDVLFIVVVWCGVEWCGVE
mgnify:CR=1 FL=1